MEELRQILKQILLVIQFLAALTGCFYFFKLKENYWKWFAVYLVIIFIQEFFISSVIPISDNTKQIYNLFVGIPFEFIFLYWLYAIKSLQRNKLFIAYTFISFVTLAITSYTVDIRTAISFCLSVGSLLLFVLVILEYLKQIRNDSIIKFRENRMFYINFGVVIFYMGCFPFHGFQKYLFNDYKDIVAYYYIYFLIANCILYLLFIASLVCGKDHS